MFGDFLQQFGLNFSVDPQGGLFAPAGPPDQPGNALAPPAPGGPGGGLNMAAPGGGSAKAPPGVTAPPGTITPSPAPATAPQPATAVPSPLASPLALGGGGANGTLAPPQNEPAAPAAGVGSQFGKTGL